jgi:hypothetical protein
VNSFLRFVQVFALGAWVGSILYFSSVVTQGAFRVLPTVDDAGRLVGFTLNGLHWMGIGAAIVYLAATIVIGRSPAALLQPAALGVLLMLLLTLASHGIVIPRMDALRLQMGSVAATAATDSRRVQFDRLHDYSVYLESGVLLAGIASLFLTVRAFSRP